MSLALMLRPSDVAPNANMFDETSFQVQKILFTTDNLKFTSEGMHVTFFGIKNDTSRTGFKVYLPRHANVLLDPVSTLEDYIARTTSVRTDKAVFLSLRHPHKAICASSVAKVLEQSIALAGLADQGFSAKSFRPTGATVAIGSGVDPHIVQTVGRWKSTDVFYEHYVHTQTPKEFATQIIPDLQ
jgi:integrase